MDKAGRPSRGAVNAGMHIGFYNFYTAYNQNRMFLSPESTIGDRLAAPAVEMAALMTLRGHRVSTIDMAPLRSFDAIVFLDYPTRWNGYFRSAVRHKTTPLYLVLLENESIRPDNYDRRNHAAFRKIFTWNDDWVDGERYVKAFNSVDFSRPRNAVGEAREHFCALIANNKFSNHPQELYSARRETLSWFASNAPGDIVLYGEGWDRWHAPGMGFVANAALSMLYRKIPALPRRAAFPFWRGSTSRKREVLADTKFCICYENAVFPGYITEKIFDCFFAGCVPVYWGPRNASRYLPAATYIDRTRFATHEELYEYLRGMSDRDYAGYRAAIEEFLASDAARLFSAKHATQIFLEHVAGEPPGPRLQGADSGGE